MHITNFFGKQSPEELLKEYGSPLYVYNEDILRERCRELLALSNHPQFFVNYSAKANTNIHLLKMIKEEGCVVDAMSPGELLCNLKAGFEPQDILYVCNNVSAEEMQNACKHNVLMSLDSLDQLELFGQSCPNSPFMIRVNPGIGAGHHQKVITAGKDTKFGIDPKELQEGGAVQTIAQKYGLRLAGLNQHIGSLFMEAKAYMEAVQVLLDIASTIKGLEIIDFGGGFGIPYRKSEGQARLDLAELGKSLHACLTEFCEKTGYQGRFFIEPGRYLVAESGMVLGHVHATKHNGEKRFIGTDIGFNVIMRPIMYDAHHDIAFFRDGQLLQGEATPQTVVGNICESGDILAKDRPLPQAERGDVVAVLDAGAYGFVMASSYNQRPRPAEILLCKDGSVRCIRKKETIEDLLKNF